MNSFMDYMNQIVGYYNNGYKLRDIFRNMPRDNRLPFFAYSDKEYFIVPSNNSLYSLAGTEDEYFRSIESDYSIDNEAISSSKGFSENLIIDIYASGINIIKLVLVGMYKERQLLLFGSMVCSPEIAEKVAKEDFNIEDFDSGKELKENIFNHLFSDLQRYYPIYHWEEYPDQVAEYISERQGTTTPSFEMPDTYSQNSNNFNNVKQGFFAGIANKLFKKEPQQVSQHAHQSPTQQSGYYSMDNLRQARNVAQGTGEVAMGATEATTGTTLEAGGATLQAAGTAAKVAGGTAKIVGGLGKVTGKVGEGVGVGVDATGKLMMGIPVVGTVLGSITSAAGVTVKTAGQGVAAAGTVTSLSGKVVGKAGSVMSDVGKDIKEKGSDIREEGVARVQDGINKTKGIDTNQVEKIQRKHQVENKLNNLYEDSKISKHDFRDLQSEINASIGSHKSASEMSMDDIEAKIAEKQKEEPKKNKKNNNNISFDARGIARGVTKSAIGLKALAGKFGNSVNFDDFKGDGDFGDNGDFGGDGVGDLGGVDALGDVSDATDAIGSVADVADAVGNIADVADAVGSVADAADAIGDAADAIG